ncbi:MAG: efflux RND transporter periplasmic adaptor subunit [Elusimicrobia bacterium]|nr:efflux RND transporter periplasmic adaptor subunit [Elusimicrobiota bacterium]
MRKKLFKRKLTWFVLIFIAVSFVSCGYFKKIRKAKSAKPMYAFKISKNTFVVKVYASGVAEPENRVPVIPTFGGRIEDILVKEGQRVASGQILAWMSSIERAALLDSAKARNVSSEELKVFENAYKPTPLVAPINGTVIQRAVEPGQPVAANQTILALSDRLIIRTSVDETDIGKVSENQAAQFILDAFPKETHSGRVVSIAHEAKTTGNITTYEVKVLPFKAPPNLRAGMTADVHITVETKLKALLVPKEAVTYKAGSPTVMFLETQGKEPVQRPVELGLSDKKNFEIISGVVEGDTVMISSETKKSEDITIRIGGG